VFSALAAARISPSGLRVTALVQLDCPPLSLLRDEGLADFIGISGGPASLLERFVETTLFDAVITHNRYTLVDRTADRLISRAHELGIGVLNAAVYGGGILAAWPRVSDLYHYAPASEELLGAVDAMGAACARYGVPLRNAAVQFSTRDARISSTVCGVPKGRASSASASCITATASTRSTSSPTESRGIWRRATP